MAPSLIIQGIMAAIAAAPQIEALVISGKEFIKQMFSAGLIDKATQDAAMVYVDAVCAAAIAGIIPPAFQVQPDPK